MSSSTSSSKSIGSAPASTGLGRRGVVTILLVLAGLLGLAEAGLRQRETSLSVDLEHIRSIPSIVKQMDAAPHPRVLFLGNSLTRYGVQVQTINEVLTERGGELPSFHVIFPDDSGLTDWHYLYERYLKGAGSHPDVLIVSYALSELDDDQPLHPERLGRYFSNLQAAPEMFQYDLKHFDERAIFVMSNLSSLFANRERIRERALAAVIPGYRDTAQAINFSIRAAAQQRAARVSPGQAPAPTYAKLERFVSMVRNSGARIIIVAMPQPGVYFVSPDLIHTVTSNGGEFVDLRTVEGISKTDFFDGFHLAPDGAHRYSEALSRKLMEQHLVQNAAVVRRPMKITKVRR